MLFLTSDVYSLMILLYCNDDIIRFQSSIAIEYKYELVGKPARMMSKIKQFHCIVFF